MSGKTIPFVLFKLQTRGVDLYLTNSGLTYVFTESADSANHRTDKRQRWERIDLTLKGATILRSRIVTHDSSAYHFNYFHPAHNGIFNVSDYGRITIKSVYPGIDWVLYNTSESGFKYDFIVHPGASARDIVLCYESQSKPSISHDGNLQVPGAFGNITEMAPYSYSALDKKQISSRYRFVAQQWVADHYRTLVKFEVAHQADEVLVIDPQLKWATFYGGNQWEAVNSITTDTTGNVFAVGNTSSSNFPTQNAGTYYQGFLNAGPSNEDVFILKFDNLGGLIWGTYYGGNSEDHGLSVTTDPVGNVFVTGSTKSLNFPLLNAGTFYQPVKGGVNTSSNAFILKFDNSGTRLWATYCGGSGGDVANSIKADKSGNVFLTGVTASSNFPLLNAGTYYNGSLPGNASVGFIMKFLNNGTLNWSTYWGSTSVSPNCIETDLSGNVVICGKTGNSGSIPLQNPGFMQNSPQGGGDAFISKFTNSGVLKWSTYVGGTGIDAGSALITDKEGNIFFTGITKSQNFVVMNGGGYYKGTLSSNSNDAFIMKFDSTCFLKWSTYYGGSLDEGMLGSRHLGVDNCGNVYLGFYTASTDNFVKSPCDGGFFDNSLASAVWDHFLVRFSNTGNLHWASYFGGNGIDAELSIAVDKFGSLFAGGGWHFPNTAISYPLAYPGLPTYYDATFNGQHDAFMAKFTAGIPTGAPEFSYPTPVCKNSSTVAPIPNAGFIGGGTYSSTPGLTLNPSTGVITLSSTVPGTYTVSYTGGSCGCITGPPLTTTLEVSPAFSVTVKSGTACPGNAATLIAIPSSTAMNTEFLWSANGEETNSIVVSPTVNTVYTVMATAGGCTAMATGSVLVTLPTAPFVGFNMPELCTTAKEAFPNLFDGFVTGGTFSTQPGLPIDSLTGKVLLTNATPGDYVVTYTINPKGCLAGASHSYAITVYSPVQLSVDPYVKIKPGESITLRVSGGYEYEWFPTENLSCINCSNPVASPLETTQYCVGSAVFSCYSTTCITVEVLCGNGTNLSVPNAFTPNNDGRNEKFCLQGWERCNTAFNVVIFDRWGEKVFESNEPNFCWDGNLNGQPLNAGVFVIVINAAYIGEEPFTLKGNITMVR